MLNILVALALAAAVPSGKLTVKTEDLTVTLESRAAWTIRSVDYLGDRLIIPAGGQGAVVMPKRGTWLGSAMSSKETEPVSAVTVTAGGKPVEVAPGQTVAGDAVAIKKVSMLAGLLHTAETTFGKDLFVQRHRFVAQEDVTLQNFYAFIYSLTPAAKSWLAQPLAGDVRRGSFAQDGSHKPGGLCRWLAQYDPAIEKGTLIYFQTPFSGTGASTLFWDTKGYHKFFAQPMRNLIKKGTALDYTLVMQFFSAPAGQWEGRAQKLAGELQSRFPQKGAPIVAPKKLYGPGVPEHGMLTCKTAHYTVPFEADRAWTIYSISYDDQLVSHHRGFYGTVMVPKRGRWWGTGHTEGGREIVDALKLTVDGQERPVAPGETVEGSKITFLKRSTIWKFKATVEVTVTDDHIFERTQLEALEDCEQKLMYYFMHCFVPTTTKWLAQLPDGELESADIDASGKMAVNRDTRWVAQYEPNFGVGILCYTPKVIAGKGSASLIWQRTNYHKFYYRQNLGQAFNAGDKLDFAVVVKVVPGETGDWSATKAAAAALAKAYPAVED